MPNDVCVISTSMSDVSKAESMSMTKFMTQANLSAGEGPNGH